jgi:leader peptidase (prepilin peptidase)/N-methyltransferase
LWIDDKQNYIYIGNNLFIFIMGLIKVGIEYGITGNFGIVIMHIEGFFAVSAFLLVLHIATHGNGMGIGDVYLMAASGFVLGWQLVILAFFIGCILAAVIHPICMKVRHVDRVLAFGPYLSAGICISLLFGRQLIMWYLQTYY